MIMPITRLSVFNNHRNYNNYYYYCCCFIISHLLLLSQQQQHGGGTRTVVAVFASALEDNPLLLQATYRGRFEYLRGTTCDGPNPVLSIKCKSNNATSSSQLDIVDVSDPTIVCSKANDTTAICTTTCDVDNSGECNSIWLETGTTATPGDGVFGNITFTCSSSDNNIGAEFTYSNTEGEDGNCGFGFNTRNYHIAQLGILCDEDDEYKFDGNYFECTSGISFSSQVITSNIQPTGVYTCGSGDSCNNCNVQYDDVILTTEEHRIPPTCVEALANNEDYVPPTTPSRNNPSTMPEGEYTVKFQALWSIAYRFPRVFCDWDDARPKVTMTCTNGGTIQLVDTLWDTVDCMVEDSSTSTIICEEPTGDNFLSSLRARDYSGAIFECTTTDVLPEAAVVMDEIDVTCDGKSTSSLTPQVVGRLRLGIDCGDTSSDFRYYDPFVECFDDNTFDSPLQSPLDALENLLEYDIYECNSIISFPLDTEETKRLGPVGVYTDYTWSHNVEPNCFIFDAP